MVHATSIDVHAAGRGQGGKTKRICATVQHRTYLALARRSSREGRSISNLVAYLLDLSLMDQEASGA